MLVHVKSAKCTGIEAVKVTVEIDIVPGIGTYIVGLADTAVKESLLRTCTALGSIGFRIPGKKIIINLAPANLHKKGSGYDAPIAVGIIAASGQLELPLMDSFMILGELGLNGELRAIPGAICFAELAAAEGCKGIILPAESATEAAGIEGTAIYGAHNLKDILKILSGEEDCGDLLAGKTADPAIPPAGNDSFPDFSDILGQEGAKRGMEIAAAGNHNVILIGPPGSGKTSLARALSGILPPPTKEESLMISKIWSISGKKPSGTGFISQRPFRAPHYSISAGGLIGGGGADFIIPGEVSLAHNGVLFIDEFGQMPKSMMEALRGPLEDRKVTVSRIRSKNEYPASFMFVVASNPCPCGYYGQDDRCCCTVAQRLNYLARLSGPVQDRIDLHLWMSAATPSALDRNERGESSAVIAERVRRAREIQQKRFASEDILTNSQMNNRQIERFCPLSRECSELLGRLMESQGLSMRAYFRIIRVARTIADIAGEEKISPQHLAEAAGYRFLDKAKL